MKRKKAAKIFIIATLIVWTLLFVIYIAHYSSVLYDVEGLYNDGLREEDVESIQFGIAVMFAFILPPVFLVGVLFFCGVYHLIKGCCTRLSVILRSIYVIVSSLTLFLTFGGEFVRSLTHLSGYDHTEVIFFACPIVFVFGLILELVSFRLDRRQTAKQQ